LRKVVVIPAGYPIVWETSAQTPLGYERVRVNVRKAASLGLYPRVLNIVDLPAQTADLSAQR